jgi:hypothetical protein
MAVRDIPRGSWRDELDSFSRQHEGWLVSVKVTEPGGESALAAKNLPLQGVRAIAPQSDDIAIVVGDRPNRITHDVHDAARLSLDLTAEGAKRALLIHGRDGTTTSIEFRSPMRPEEVDGFPAFERE